MAKVVFETRFWAALIVILVAAALRLLPHPPNFTPIMAMALFGGATFSRRAFAFAIPLLAMSLSDLALGLHSTLLAVYIAIVLVAVIGSQLKKRSSVSRLGLASVAGSVLFFVITNLAVWMTGELYPLTGAGLLACFVAAVPFFGNALVGDLLFTAAFFGAWAFVSRWLPHPVSA